jgi:RNA-directed DNA polymerase
MPRSSDEAGEPSRRDPVERRRHRRAKPLEEPMTGISSPANISLKLERIARLAKQSPAMQLTSLNHYIDEEWLMEAYRRTRKSGAPGTDGQSAAQYATDLEDNLRSLLSRAKNGTYRAPPVRRVHIPKGEGPQTRPIGIPTFEDKVLQRAASMVLNAVYEQDFLPCSYGFRPGRSAHQLLEDLRTQLMRMEGGYVLEVDLEKFFDTMDHACLREVLQQRIRDGVLLRLIGKWLNAGVLEEGRLSRPEAGTPQGGVISPLLANIFLHDVLDRWFEHEVRPRLRSGAYLYRYADDIVIVFAAERDALRVQEVLPKRLHKYGLSIHPDKTRLSRFKKPAGGGAGPERELPVLGFSLHWGKSRRGFWTVKAKTHRSRINRALKHAVQWCRQQRHRPIRWQWDKLSRKLRGHYAYFGITGNTRALRKVYEAVRRIWWKWLNRRGNRSSLSWEQMGKLLKRHPLPSPRIVHSYIK